MNLMEKDLGELQLLGCSMTSAKLELMIRYSINQAN